MKESTRDAVFNALYWLLIVLLFCGSLYVSFNLGMIKGMTDAHKIQLKKQIEMLEEEKQELMIRQILNETNNR